MCSVRFAKSVCVKVASENAPPKPSFLVESGVAAGSGRRRLGGANGSGCGVVDGVTNSSCHVSASGHNTLNQSSMAAMKKTSGRSARQTKKKNDFTLQAARAERNRITFFFFLFPAARPLFGIPAMSACTDDKLHPAGPVIVEVTFSGLLTDDGVLDVARALMRETGALASYVRYCRIILVWARPSGFLGDRRSSLSVFFAARATALLSGKNAAIGCAKTEAVVRQFMDGSNLLDHLLFRQREYITSEARTRMWRRFCDRMLEGEEKNLARNHATRQKMPRERVAELFKQFRLFNAAQSRHDREGTFLCKTVVKRELSAERLAAIPEAFRPASGAYDRVVITELTCDEAFAAMRAKRPDPPLPGRQRLKTLA